MFCFCETFQNLSCPVTSETSLPQVELHESDVDEITSPYVYYLTNLHRNLSSKWDKQSSVRKIIYQVVLVIAFVIYFGFAMFHERLQNEGSVRLLWLTCFTALIFGIGWCRNKLRASNIQCLCWNKVSLFVNDHNDRISWYVIIIVKAIFCLVFRCTYVTNYVQLIFQSCCPTMTLLLTC